MSFWPWFWFFFNIALKKKCMLITEFLFFFFLSTPLILSPELALALPLLPSLPEMFSFSYPTCFPFYTRFKAPSRKMLPAFCILKLRVRLPPKKKSTACPVVPTDPRTPAILTSLPHLTEAPKGQGLRLAHFCTVSPLRQHMRRSMNMCQLGADQIVLERQFSEDRLPCSGW